MRTAQQMPAPPLSGAQAPPPTARRPYAAAPAPRAAMLSPAPAPATATREIRQGRSRSPRRDLARREPRLGGRGPIGIEAAAPHSRSSPGTPRLSAAAAPAPAPTRRCVQDPCRSTSASMVAGQRPTSGASHLLFDRTGTRAFATDCSQRAVSDPIKSLPLQPAQMQRSATLLKVPSALAAPTMERAHSKNVAVDSGLLPSEVARAQANPQRNLHKSSESFTSMMGRRGEIERAPPTAKTLELWTPTYSSSVALARFSTGVMPDQAQPDIRAGWFKSPVENVSMEQLNHAHDRGCFFAFQLDHVAPWKECYIEFCKGGFSAKPQLNILSASAAFGGQFRAPSSSSCVALFFPGFDIHAIKLLLRSPGTACCTMLGESPRHPILQYALIRPAELPLGLSVNLRPKSLQDLTHNERLAKEYFIKVVMPGLGAHQDDVAARIECLVDGLSSEEIQKVAGYVPAIFDDRPGAQVEAVRFRGTAKSASAPSFVELWQSVPGQAAQVKHVLLKRGDNPHQDRFALAMARVFNHLWQREGVGVSVAGRGELVQNVVYGVLQAGVRSSIIEVVNGSSPVRSFHDRHSKAMMAMFGDAWWQGDLNDWVPSAPLLASAAAAFTTAYVLGVGDRHQDNMLVTRDGRLFNIDFGYLFGDQPRFIDAKPFAIPVALRTALVQNGPLWGTFKAACVRAFAALVKHREFVILQAIETARALGSHYLITHALTFGQRLAEAGLQAAGSHSDTMHNLLNSLDASAGDSLDSYVQAVGHELSQSIERGVYGHQTKDIVHERRCSIM
eukprot:TRINITY_DN21754_c0_g2_i1.p1 TRINITY_DN21754_c0_g2~~TRINITY_DN21754_c0_g2_i1.p1  ORF type:complete len:788 (+),score=77.49 TRINITY_DN21754_c0_g2_i1:54-2417(+)